MEKVIIYNSLSKTKETLEPTNPPNINIYTCGPTVYDDSHIGHARSAITWDFIIRYLRFIEYKVNWARNITDIDDKIINKAKELNLSPDKVARIYTYSFYEDMNAFGINCPDFEPRATQYLYQMFAFVEGLLKSNYAYQIKDDIYFSVNSFKSYGKLKGQSIKELEKGFGRIEPNEKKKNNLDFALWKGIKNKDEYGFESPWGKGRPGWHLECSAMNYSLFKTELDIHGGGDDLIFPHHENEIAQSESFTGKPFAKYWMHNAMILVNDKKMSKSEGNYITIKESLKSFTANAIRLFVLNTHYRMPLNCTNKALISAQNGVNRLKEALSDYDSQDQSGSKKDLNDNEFTKEFISVMSNDFNTPQALAILFNLSDKINTETNSQLKYKYQNVLIYISNNLGLDLLNQKLKNASIKEKSLIKIIDLIMDWRTTCKQNKDFKNADKIRSILTDSFIEVKDLPDNNSKWRFKI